jgi:hypothetical protein
VGKNFINGNTKMRLYERTVAWQVTGLARFQESGLQFFLAGESILHSVTDSSVVLVGAITVCLRRFDSI